MGEFPTIALSIRQPWAWAIIHAGKDIENRDWKPSNPGIRKRGLIAVHAAKGMTKAEYAAAREFMRGDLGITCPPAFDLPRGGLVGAVEIVDVVRDSASRWFFGPLGLVLRNAKPCAFRPVVGQLGFFKWEAPR